MTTTRICIVINATSKVCETYASWCLENVGTNDWWATGGWICIYFVCEEDATAFKLRFQV